MQRKPNASALWLKTFSPTELTDALFAIFAGRFPRGRNTSDKVEMIALRIHDEIARRKRGYVEVRPAAIYALFLFSILFALCTFRVCVMHGDDYLDARPVTGWHW